MHFSFDTPVGTPAASQCGRVDFSDFHVEAASGAGALFPQECTAGSMTPQEKLYEFLVFDEDACQQ